MRRRPPPPHQRIARPTVPPHNVTVIGAGAWGTALALQAHRAGNRVYLWSRRPLTGRESPRLPGHLLPNAITCTTTLPTGPATTILAIPAQQLRPVLASLEPQGALLVCAKGVEAGTLRLPLEILAELHPGTPAALLAGPNFAHEVAAGLPAAAAIASTDASLRAHLVASLATPAFRLYGNDDPLGAQLGAAAKNVIAIAAGAVIGAGLGENARAALVTRGLAELARLVTALGGRPETVMGLTGLGDLLLTCTGTASRNYRCGLALGSGIPLTTILARAEGVIEGVATAPALVARAAGLDLPICQAVTALLAGQLSMQEAIATLLSRPARDE